jgi:hypothetical protein
MTGAILIRWGSNVPGRETKGLEVFGKAIERFEQLAKSGRIHAHHEYIALTGTPGGFMIIEGEVEELQKILVEPENLALTTEASLIVNNFDQQIYGGGSDKSVQDLIGVYLNGLQSLGYA